MKYLLKDAFFFKKFLQIRDQHKKLTFGDWYSVPAMYEPPRTLYLRLSHLESFVFLMHNSLCKSKNVVLFGGLLMLLIIYSWIDVDFMMYA